VTAAPERVAGQRPNLSEFGLTTRVWRFFRSIRLALFLILALAALILIGTLVEQVPASVRADPGAYQQWIEQVRGKYGIWTDAFERLQFYHIFSALYFRGIIALLAVNIVVCTMNRWRAIWITVFRSRVRMTESFFDHARFNTTLDSPLGMEETAKKMKHSLRFGRFRVSTENAGDSIAMLADKNRFSVYGTFLTHLSLVLILAGAVLGGLLGFSDPQFIVAEGSSRTVTGTDLSLRLEHFADEYYLEGAPKDYRSEVTLFDGGREVKKATIRVNSPLRYDGYAFYQSFYGQTAIMNVTDADGNTIYSDGVPLAWQTRDGSRPVGGFTLPEQNISAWVVGPRSGEDDPLIKAGEMQLELYRGNARLGFPEILAQGEPVEVQGLTFTFERESRFTGLKVAKDPGVNIIWIASTLMVVGMVMLFYFPRKRAWALLKARPDGTTEVRLAMPAQRDLSPAGEFGRLRTRVAKALGATPEKQGSGED